MAAPLDLKNKQRAAKFGLRSRDGSSIGDALTLTITPIAIMSYASWSNTSSTPFNPKKLRSLSSTLTSHILPMKPLLTQIWTTNSLSCSSMISTHFTLLSSIITSNLMTISWLISAWNVFKKIHHHNQASISGKKKQMQSIGTSAPTLEEISPLHFISFL